jgi:hypothetical protein
MKFYQAFVSVLFLFLIISNTQLFPQELSDKQLSIPKNAEVNYLKCLESEIDEVRISAIFYLGEIKSVNAVGNLIYTLRYDRNYAARLVSALSLIKIGDPSGIAEVKKIPKMTPTEYSNLENHVLFLSILWNQYLQKNPKEAIALKSIKFEYKSEI